MRLNIEIFVFLLDQIWHFIDNLVNDIIHVLATSSSADSIHEGYLLKLPIGERN